MLVTQVFKDSQNESGQENSILNMCDECDRIVVFLQKSGSTYLILQLGSTNAFSFGHDLAFFFLRF